MWWFPQANAKNRVFIMYRVYIESIHNSVGRIPDQDAIGCGHPGAERISFRVTQYEVVSLAVGATEKSGWQEKMASAAIRGAATASLRKWWAAPAPDCIITGSRVLRSAN